MDLGSYIYMHHNNQDAESPTRLPQSPPDVSLSLAPPLWNVQWAFQERPSFAKMHYKNNPKGQGSLWAMFVDLEMFLILKELCGAAT